MYNGDALKSKDIYIQVGISAESICITNSNYTQLSKQSFGTNSVGNSLRYFALNFNLFRNNAVVSHLKLEICAIFLFHTEIVF